MKASKWAILFAMASGLCAATAFGQSGLRQPGQVAPVGFDYANYDYYAAQDPAPTPSPSDAAVPAPPANGHAAGAVAAPGGNGCCNGDCDSCASGGCDAGCDDCAMECPECEPWRLFNCGECSPWKFRGWLNGGITWNGDNPPSRFNGPVTFNDREDGQFNQWYFIMERTLNTECGQWDWGGRVALLYGSDYRFTISRGLDAHDNFTAKWNSDDRFYGLAMPQAYLQAGNGTWDVKLGHFYTILGYEVVPSPDNFFYSHAYTMQYGEPF